MSWACRSFLGRSHPLVISRLRPVHRHASRPTAVLDRDGPIGSQGYASNSNSDGDSHAKVPTKRHLYVVLDDHKDGYGIHKLDLGAEDGDDDLDGGGVRPLPDPPLMRVVLATVGERAQFAAVGSGIVAIGTPFGYSFWPSQLGVLLIYDTKTAAMAVSPQLPRGFLRDGYKAALAVGNRLYILEAKSDVWNSGGYLHCLRDGDGHDDVGGWICWQPLFNYPRWCWSADSTPRTLPFSTPIPRTLPFCTDYIMAYAAHRPPAGRHEDVHEIFVSVRSTDRSEYSLRNRLGVGTFSFSTATGEWTRRGNWQLPAHDHAHYDGELGAWLGLHAVNYEGDIYRPRVADGRLCAGHVTSHPTEWKVGREQLFRLDEDAAAGWRHVDAKLVPMVASDGGSEYCIMERLRPNKEKEKEVVCINGVNHWYEEEEEEEEEECLLRLTGFRVKRGEDGEPVATARRPPRSYKLYRHNKNFEAQAFWM